MTIAAAWVRTLDNGAEELIFCSDSRLSGGKRFDNGQKIFKFTRTDAAICFAGETDWAYPMIVCAINAVNIYEPSRSRVLSLKKLMVHLKKILNQMQSTVHKKDLASFVRFCEFMSQIVDYNDRELEKMALFARHLAPLLREHRFDVDALDLDHVALSEYRMIKLRQQELQLKKNTEGEGLLPIDSLGSGRPIDPKEEFLSSIIERLNTLFDKKDVDGEVLLGTPDKLNYFNTICDRVRQKGDVMMQIQNNTPDQALLGDFPKAMDEAIMDCAIIHEDLTRQLLSDPTKLKAFMKVVLDVLLKAG